MNSRAVKKPINTVLALTVLASSASVRTRACEGEIATPDAFIREAETAVVPDAEKLSRAAQTRAKAAVQKSGRPSTASGEGATGRNRSGGVAGDAGTEAALAFRAMLLAAGPPR